MVCLPVVGTPRPAFDEEQGYKGCSEVIDSRVAGVRGETLRRLETLGVLPKASSRMHQWPEMSFEINLLRSSRLRVGHPWARNSFQAAEELLAGGQESLSTTSKDAFRPHGSLGSILCMRTFQFKKKLFCKKQQGKELSRSLLRCQEKLALRVTTPLSRTFHHMRFSAANNSDELFMPILAIAERQQNWIVSTCEISASLLYYAG